MGIGRNVVISFLALAGFLQLAAAQAPPPPGDAQVMEVEASKLLAEANDSRREQGVGLLRWDRALAAAALKHCMRMAAERQIAHQFAGEPDPAERAGEAGAKFSVAEENVAWASNPGSIHQGWMQSPEHRANLLSPRVDRVGIAVVLSRGHYYAVADYSRAVPALGQSEVEARIGAMVRAKGVAIKGDASDARTACAMEQGLPKSLSGLEPHFVIRWQDTELASLPKALVDRLRSGDYKQAAVGSCPTTRATGPFTAYRLAVLLYGPPSTNDVNPFY
jgi:uncharacterized protein YkwD